MDDDHAALIRLSERSRSDDERAANRTADVFAKLRHAIATGELRPNERLIESDLAERLSVSRTPIREALHRLSADGMVVSRGRTWVVYEHSREEVRWLYECRAALESEAGRLAAARGRSEELQEIRRLAEMAADADPVTELVRLNDPFHEAVIEASRNPSLREMIHRSRIHYFNVRMAMTYTADHAVAFHDEHLAMADALLAGDGHTAAELSRKHVEHSLDLVLTRLVI